MLQVNGLVLDKVASCFKIYNELIIEDFEQLAEKTGTWFNGDGLVVAYLDYKVLVGKYLNKRFSFYYNETFATKYLQRMRVFNENSELLLWQCGGGSFNSRLRVDGEGELQDYVDAEQVIWGTKSKALADGFSLLTEKRGIAIVLPLANLVVDEKEKRVKLKTRNYIGYNEAGQAGYEDCRFISLGL